MVSTGNVGDARYAGFEAAAELDILAMINGGAESPYGQFNLYGNITWLDAEFTSGPNNGLTPAYAPDYQFKVGGIMTRGAAAGSETSESRSCRDRLRSPRPPTRRAGP